MTELISLEDLLMEKPELTEKPFIIKMEGSELVSPISEVDCIHYEVSFLLIKEGVEVGYVDGEVSEDPIIVKYNDKYHIELGINRIRTYISPYNRNEYTRESDIDYIQEMFDNYDIDKLVELEYLLLKNQEYHALIKERVYRLPPENDTEKPNINSILLLWISDKPFVPSPQVDLTPYYKGWTY